MCRQLEGLAAYWRNGYAILHTLPQHEAVLGKYLMLFKESKSLNLGNLTPVSRLERLWNVYEPYIECLQHRRQNGNRRLTKVVGWLLASPMCMSRCLAIRYGSVESFHLVFAIRDAFYNLRAPLPYRVTVIIWDMFTHWLISDNQKYQLLAASTPLHDPLETEHNTFEFMMYGPYGLHLTYGGSTTIRITPK